MRAQLAPLRNAVKAAEKRLDELHRRQTAVQARLADPTLYDGPTAGVTELQKEAGDIERALAAAEESWMEAQEALESAEAAAN